MAEIIWTESALEDLDEIIEYIAISNPTAAANLTSDVFLKVDRLDQFPKSGKKLIEIPELNYREIIVSPSRVLYRLEKNFAYVVHVFREEISLRKFMIECGKLN
jgi:toxin ParE1/3/4